MDDAPHYRPLYRQVYDYLVKQIAEGAWKPGTALPSEQALAAKLGVSQGTVRKALDSLTVEKLVERRQGKGTYVAEHTPERALFRFFRLSSQDGMRATPTSSGESVRRRKARREDVSRLKIIEGSVVIEINRVRLVNGEPVIRERIVVPAALCPGLDKRAELPNALYTLYQHEYGHNIVAAHEELRADLATREDARRLRLGEGAPILHIDRIAVSLEGLRVEWRSSRCDTSHLVYAVTLS